MYKNYTQFAVSMQGFRPENSISNSKKAYHQKLESLTNTKMTADLTFTTSHYYYCDSQCNHFQKTFLVRVFLACSVHIIKSPLLSPLSTRPGTATRLRSRISR